VALQHAFDAAYDADGQNVVLQVLEPGQVLGWSWLFPPHYWRFSAEAVEPVQAVFLYGTRLRETAEADPAFGYQLMKRAAHIVIERLQDVRQRLIDRR
jgi:CRP/FNR family cyclic AMP-dependent transcriptional regulator